MFLERPAIQREIKDKAASLWDKKGRPQRKDVEIWLEAEKKVVQYYWQYSRNSVICRRNRRWLGRELWKALGLIFWWD